MITDMYVDSVGACGTIRRFVVRLDHVKTFYATIDTQASRLDLARALRGIADAIFKDEWHEPA